MVRDRKVPSWKVRQGNFIFFRTDNAIKNHFYSKLRKFIRKILKQINKDGLLKQNGIDPNKFNSDKVYKMIKKFKIPYNSLNKDSILKMIISQEKSNKGTGNNILGTKTKRGTTKKESGLYSQKVLRRSTVKRDDEAYKPTTSITTRSRRKVTDRNVKKEVATPTRSLGIRSKKEI